MSCRGHTKSPDVLKPIEKKAPVLKRNEKMKKSLSIDGW